MDFGFWSFPNPIIRLHILRHILRYALPLLFMWWCWWHYYTFKRCWFCRYTSLITSWWLSYSKNSHWVLFLLVSYVNLVISSHFIILLVMFRIDDSHKSWLTQAIGRRTIYFRWVKSTSCCNHIHLCSFCLSLFCFYLQHSHLAHVLASCLRF